MTDNKAMALQRLEWLKDDPGNMTLRLDTLTLALNNRLLDIADQLIRTTPESDRDNPNLRNLSGLLALKRGDAAAAIAHFESLHDAGIVNDATRFNLAWCHALEGRHEEALALLSDELAEALPQAAALRVQTLHTAGQFETAQEQAKALMTVHPEDRGLMAAISTLALDMADRSLALTSAKKAGEHPDALTTLGLLHLEANRTEEAEREFARALALNDRQARAWIGQGLARLRNGFHEAAAQDLDCGARLFGTHLGSWLAAGWAYFSAGDLQTCRARFTTAMDIDPNFAESHGSLAVLNLVEGDSEAAERQCEVAFRLNRQCFSATLAKSIMLEAAGDTGKAQALVARAMAHPIDAEGRSLGAMLSGLTGGGAGSVIFGANPLH
ncbi:MAG: tetratricopeptide repeat protein [Pseudomonadota bacterium]